MRYQTSLIGFRYPFSAGFSRARWLFARAHGRPDGVPGGILGAREESLRRTERRRPSRRNKGAIQKKKGSKQNWVEKKGEKMRCERIFGGNQKNRGRKGLGERLGKGKLRG